MIRENESKGRVLVVFLLVVILGLVLVVFIREPNVIVSAVKSSQQAVGPKEDKVVSITLKSINYWEAQFLVEYEHSIYRKPGYLTVTAEQWTPNVGLNTHPGSGNGVSLLARRSDKAGGYSDSYVEGRMYDPYKNDSSYVKEKFAIKLEWPGTEVFPGMENRIGEKYKNIKSILVYRNVPDYITFSNKLTYLGFSPEKITMMLSVCPGCAGSLIYGDEVGFSELQSILRLLKDVGFSLPQVFYSEEPKDVGRVRIGASPPADAWPLWDNIDVLIGDSVKEVDFFALMGKKLLSPKARAKVLTAKAKRLIDRNRKKDTSKIRMFLDKAIELDETYIEAYLESARLIMRGGPFSEDYITDEVKETARVAKRLILSAKEMSPEYSNTYVLLGYVQSILGELDQAKMSFDLAELYGSNNLWLHSNRALMYRYKENERLMILSLEQMLDAIPNGDDNDRPLKFGLNDLALAYLNAGRVDDAFMVFRTLYRHFPKFYIGKSNYIKRAIAFGKVDDEIESMIAYYKGKGSNIYYHAAAMIGVVSAASLINTDLDAARRAVAKSQASSKNFNRVLSDLTFGPVGLESVGRLYDVELLSSDIFAPKDK